MADVILKDANGNDVEYSGVTQLKVPYRNSAGELADYKFTSLTSLNVYAISYQSDGNYLVQKKLSYIPTQNYVYFGLYDTDFEELNETSKIMDSGKIWYNFILTTKTLTVGETYAIEDMY